MKLTISFVSKLAIPHYHILDGLHICTSCGLVFADVMELEAIYWTCISSHDKQM